MYSIGRNNLKCFKTSYYSKINAIRWFKLCLHFTLTIRSSASDEQCNQGRFNYWARRGWSPGARASRGPVIDCVDCLARRSPKPPHLPLIRDRAQMVRGPYWICSVSYGPSTNGARTLLNLLRLLGPKPERRRALLISLGFLFLFIFFIDYPGIFGGLNMVKNSWKFAHSLEPAAIRTPQRLGPGRGTEALRCPLEHHQKTWWIAHTYLHVFIWNSVHI